MRWLIKLFFYSSENNHTDTSIDIDIHYRYCRIIYSNSSLAWRQLKKQRIIPANISGNPLIGAYLSTIFFCQHYFDSPRKQANTESKYVIWHLIGITLLPPFLHILRHAVLYFSNLFARRA